MKRLQPGFGTQEKRGPVISIGTKQQPLYGTAWNEPLHRKNMLKPYAQKKLLEAGCDEAGRGCLAGPVFAAAVILPRTFRNATLNDSKQLTAAERASLRPVIEK